MNAMAPTRPAELTGRRIRLAAGPAAAAQARRHVRAAITARHIPVDPDTAALLTSELVTNAIRHEPGPAITLAISCPPGQLRIDIHDTAPALPAPAGAPPDAEAGRGLMLVAALAVSWGCTDAGRRAGRQLGLLPHHHRQSRLLRPGVRARPRPGPRARSDVGTVRKPPAAHSPHRTRQRHPHPDHLGPTVRRADSRAMSIREWTSSFFRMWETWVATVRRDSSNLAAISGFDSPSSTNAAILISVAVRLSQPLRARRCLACGPRRMPWARNVAWSRAASAAAPRDV